MKIATYFVSAIIIGPPTIIAILFLADRTYQKGSVEDARNVFSNTAQAAAETLDTFADEQHKIKISGVSNIEKLDGLVASISVTKGSIEGSRTRTEGYTLPHIFYEKGRYKRQLVRLKEPYTNNYTTIITYLDFLALQYTASKNLELAYADKKLTSEELRSYATEMQEASKVLSKSNLNKYYDREIAAVDGTVTTTNEAADAMAARPNAPYDYERLINAYRVYAKDSDWVQANLHNLAVPLR